eukprot:TRINITY_DN76164_c0_g1_i1.p1 TRINITY_DN76164_c0_g1~~TRINITY_DN76164_c0_g1_i1.p1  ORF type:complete len:543 (+),score=45.98 TRINITY_DN76164_c0_g1_i1:88-1716(+)
MSDKRYSYGLGRLPVNPEIEKIVQARAQELKHPEAFRFLVFGRRKIDKEVDNAYRSVYGEDWRTQKNADKKTAECWEQGNHDGTRMQHGDTEALARLRKGTPYPGRPTPKRLKPPLSTVQLAIDKAMLTYAPKYKHKSIGFARTPLFNQSPSAIDPTYTGRVCAEYTDIITGKEKTPPESWRLSHSRWFTPDTLPCGCILATETLDAPVGYHLGVYIGDGQVVDFVSGFPDRHPSNGKVRLLTLQEFVAGKTHPYDCLPVSEWLGTIALGQEQKWSSLRVLAMVLTCPQINGPYIFDKKSGDDIRKRALELYKAAANSFTAYDVWTSNCEHFATKVVLGDEWETSVQVDAIPSKYRALSGLVSYFQRASPDTGSGTANKALLTSAGSCVKGSSTAAGAALGTLAPSPGGAVIGGAIGGSVGGFSVDMAKPVLAATYSPNHNPYPTGPPGVGQAMFGAASGASGGLAGGFVPSPTFDLSPSLPLPNVSANHVPTPAEWAGGVAGEYVGQRIGGYSVDQSAPQLATPGRVLQNYQVQQALRRPV